MGEKRSHIIFSLLFVLIVSLPLISEFIPLLPENRNVENRKLAVSPGFSLSEIDEFPQQYEKYFTDNFRGRSALFDLNMKIKRGLSTKPFKDNKLLIGNDGWYFSNFQKVIDDYRAVMPFTEVELEEIKKEISKTRDYLKQDGIAYYILIVPNKHTIYSDKLPYYIKKIGENSRLEQLLPVLQSEDIKVIDIRNNFLTKKNEKQLYFKTDSHWNLHGSFIGYQELFKVIKTDFPDLKLFSENDFEISVKEIPGGDIVKMMGQEKEIKDLFYVYTPKFNTSLRKGEIGNYQQPKPKIFAPENTVEVIENLDETKSQKTVVFKDSYGGYMEQFINPHFKRTVYVWGHDYDLNREIIEKEMPDIVIQIVVERYLYTLLEASEVDDK